MKTLIATEISPANALPAAGSRVSSAARGHHALVDVLRGAACLGVVLFHSLNAFSEQSLHPFLRLLAVVTQHGWLGVPVFFALSGWCIAERISRAWKQRESPLRFLADRCLRIYPAYWCALALLFLSRIAAAPFNSSGWSAVGLESPARLVLDVTLTAPLFGESMLLLVAWSLTYELGFYAMAAIALGARQGGASQLLLSSLGLALVASSLLALPTGLVSALHGWTDFFAGAAAWRAATAGTRRARASGWLMLALCFGVPFVGDAMTTPRLVALLAAALLAITAKTAGRAVGTSLRPLAALGVVSYSLYLVHVTVISPLNNLGSRFISSGSAAFILVWLAGVLAAIGVSVAFYHWIEKPCERWRRRWCMAELRGWSIPRLRLSSSGR